MNQLDQAAVQLGASDPLDIARDPHRYGGGYYDPETRSTHLGARNLLENGRFAEQDSYNVPNRYLYAQANPEMKWDPKGHATLLEALGLMVAILEPEIAPELEFIDIAASTERIADAAERAAQTDFRQLARQVIEEGKNTERVRDVSESPAFREIGNERARWDRQDNVAEFLFNEPTNTQRPIERELLGTRGFDQFNPVTRPAYRASSFSNDQTSIINTLAQQNRVNKVNNFFNQIAARNRMLIANNDEMNELFGDYIRDYHPNDYQKFRNGHFEIFRITPIRQRAIGLRYSFVDISTLDPDTPVNLRHYHICLLYTSPSPRD